MTRPFFATLAQSVFPPKQGQSPLAGGFGPMPTIPWNRVGEVVSGNPSADASGM
jgi:hypothetical protein